MNPHEIIPAMQDDHETLWTFLAIASYEPDAATARRIPVVAAHLAGWKREQDFGFLAVEKGTVIGAAWARQFAPSESPRFFVNDATPEISMAVLERCRGKGIGRRLLEALIDEAARRKVGLCLNVRDSNPAVRLYRKAGFQVVLGSEIANRVGGISMGMVLARQ